MITLLVMTDGRDELLAETLPIAAEHVPYGRLVIHDDTGSRTHRAELAERFRHLRAAVIGADRRRGFGGAIDAAWNYIGSAIDGFVVHLEDDFILNRPVDWNAVAATLDAEPHLVQLALRRQPWNANEMAAGGIVEQHPDDYTEVTRTHGTWLEHRRFFTTNPSMYRTSLCHRGWPIGPNSEGRFGIQLLSDNPTARFGFWGARDSGEWCHHIGNERVGTGY